MSGQVDGLITGEGSYNRDFTVCLLYLAVVTMLCS